MLIAFFSYRQVTCRETSKNTSRPNGRELSIQLVSMRRIVAVFKKARTRAESSSIKKDCRTGLDGHFFYASHLRVSNNCCVNVSSLGSAVRFMVPPFAASAWGSPRFLRCYVISFNVYYRLSCQATVPWYNLGFNIIILFLLRPDSLIEVFYNLFAKL